MMINISVWMYYKREQVFESLRKFKVNLSSKLIRTKDDREENISCEVPSISSPRSLSNRWNGTEIAKR